MQIKQVAGTIHYLDKYTIIEIIALTVLAIAAIAVPIAYHLRERDCSLEIDKAKCSSFSFSSARRFASVCCSTAFRAIKCAASSERSKIIFSDKPNACVQRRARAEAEETEPDYPARALELLVRRSETRRQRRRKAGRADEEKGKAATRQTPKKNQAPNPPETRTGATENPPKPVKRTNRKPGKTPEKLNPARA
jgi:hypothetical protein